MKLTTITHVSVGGVMQGPGGPDEDRRGLFERGGWTGPLYDNEAATYLTRVFERADAFLFRRWTYDVFAGSWGAMSDADHPIAAALNSRPKYVVSSTLLDPPRVNTTVLSDELTTAIADLKAKPGGELQVHGCRTLARWLFDNQAPRRGRTRTGFSPAASRAETADKG